MEMTDKEMSKIYKVLYGEAICMDNSSNGFIEIYIDKNQFNQILLILNNNQLVKKGIKQFDKNNEFSRKLNSMDFIFCDENFDILSNYENSHDFYNNLEKNLMDLYKAYKDEDLQNS